MLAKLAWRLTSFPCAALILNVAKPIQPALWVWDLGERLRTIRQEVVQLFRPMHTRQREIGKILEKRLAEAEHILSGVGISDIEMPAGSSLLSMREMQRLAPSLADELGRNDVGAVVFREDKIDVGGIERDVLFVARRAGGRVEAIAIDLTEARVIDPGVSVNRAFFDDSEHFATAFETFLQKRPENSHGTERIVNPEIEHKLDTGIEGDGNIWRMGITAYDGETLQSALKRSPYFIWKSTSLGDRIVGVKIPDGPTLMENDKGMGLQIYLNGNLCLIIKDGHPVFLPPSEIYVNTGGAITIKFERAMLSDREARRYIDRHSSYMPRCTTKELRRTGGAVAISHFIGLDGLGGGIVRMKIPKERQFEVSSIFTNLGQEIWLSSMARNMGTDGGQRKSVVKEIGGGLPIMPTVQFEPKRKKQHAENVNQDSGCFEGASCILEGIRMSEASYLPENEWKNGADAVVFASPDFLKRDAGADETVAPKKDKHMVLRDAVQELHVRKGKPVTNELKHTKIGRGGVGKNSAESVMEKKDVRTAASESGDRKEECEKKGRRARKPAPFSALSSFKAAIFDLDGVIVDSEMVHPRTFERALSKYGIRIENEHWKRAYTGIGSYAIFDDIVKKYGIREDAATLVKKRNDIYLAEIRKNRLPVIAGFPRVHAMLSENGIKEAVASGGHANHVQESMRSAGIGKMPFVAIEHVRKGKPAPEIFLKAARRLRVKPSECIVFEDSLSGVEAAARAGMPCVALSTTMRKNELEGRAALIVNNFRSKKLKKLLAVLIGKRGGGAKKKGKPAKGKKARQRKSGR